jgi:hypothetical protein
LTREDILNGSKQWLNDQIAEHVMDYHLEWDEERWGVEDKILTWCNNEGYICDAGAWQPTENMNDAWKVVEKLNELNVMIKIKQNRDYGFQVSIKEYKYNNYQCSYLTSLIYGKTVSEAICKAALIFTIEREDNLK